VFPAAFSTVLDPSIRGVLDGCFFDIVASFFALRLYVSCWHQKVYITPIVAFNSGTQLAIHTAAPADRPHCSPESAIPGDQEWQAATGTASNGFRGGRKAKNSTLAGTTGQV
jgi:hypothetical protein